MKEEIQIRRGDTVLRIRKIEEKDGPAVRELELQCFSDPWTENMLRDMLDSGLDESLLLETVLSVGECNGALSGSAEGWTAAGYANVRVLGDEAELMRICIAPEYRGRGWSATLLKAALQEMLRRGAFAATLEVRAGNTPAIRLYERHGFQKEGLRKNYYRDPVEDAAIYWKRDF